MAPAVEHRRVIVIAKKVGRLANRILLFAHFIGAAAEHDLVVVNPSFGTYAHYFPSAARDLLCRYPPGRRLPPVPGSRRLLYQAGLVAVQGLRLCQTAGIDAGLIRLDRDQQIDLNSEAFLGVVGRHRLVFVQDWFFRNADNCVRHRDVIRSYFTPWEGHLARAHAAIEPLRRRDRFVVGVHVRQGDYASFKGGRYLYTPEQYRSIMEKVAAAFPEKNVSFLVCSDAPVPLGSFAGLDVVRGTGEQLEDLYALAACDRIVGPPSTYGTWASYYGEVPLYRINDPAAAPNPDSFHVYAWLSVGTDASLLPDSSAQSTGPPRPA